MLHFTNMRLAIVLEVDSKYLSRNSSFLSPGCIPAGYLMPAVWHVVFSLHDQSTRCRTQALSHYDGHTAQCLPVIPVAELLQNDCQDT
jgi:hypothetical protein